MFYKFSSVCGRLVRSGQLQAYMPQGLQPVLKAEPTELLFESSKVKTVGISSPVSTAGSAQRAASSLAQPPVAGGARSSVAEHVRLAQEKFQAPNDIPVFLKGGQTDKVLYYSVLGLCVVGVASAFHTIYTMAFTKK